VLEVGVCRLLDAGSLAGGQVELVLKIREAMLTGVNKYAGVHPTPSTPYTLHPTPFTLHPTP